MNEIVLQPIVVGVDGSEDAIRAVRYGVEEANRTGSPIRLVHVTPETVPMAPMLPLVSADSLDQVGHRILNAAYQVVLDMSDGAVVTERVVARGPRAHALAQNADDARAVVLGHHARSIAGRVFAASTTAGVAVRARCPVICVPPDWDTAEKHGRVAVGVEEPTRGHEALAHAFAAAAARGARLSVVHAWKLPHAYDDIVVSRVALEEWRQRTAVELEASLTEFNELYPDVIVDQRILHEHPVRALIEATYDADLLVLGRHRAALSLGHYLGSTARTLIREARCPLQVIPPRAAVQDASDLLMAPEQAAPQA